MLRALRRVIARQLRVNLGECAALLLAVWPTLWLLQALADEAFNLPWPVRGCLLLGDAAAAAYLLAAYAVRPWRRKLTLPTAALLVEREIPGYRSALISAVELAHTPSGSAVLAKVLIDRVSARLQGEDVAGRVVHTRHLKRWSCWALGSVAVTLAAFLVFAPVSRVLLARVLLSRAPLPTGTVVVAISGDAAVPLGADLTLSARAQGIVPRSGRLLITYANGEQKEILARPPPDDPTVFALVLNNVQQTFRYHFELNDGVGASFRVTAQVPPAMTSCKFVQVYPAYTGLHPAEMSAGNLSLLAGSRIRLEGRATQALRSAALQFEGARQPAPLLAVTGVDRRTMSGDFVVPKEGLTGFSMRLMNTDGIASTENTVYSVEFLPDHPPTVELTAPVAERSTLLATAQLALRFSVRDDFGIKQVTLRYEVEKPAAPHAKPSQERGEVRLPFTAGVPSLAGEYLWDLSKQQPTFSVGSTVEFWIEAVDNNDVTGPGMGESVKKTLVIFSEQEKRAELLERLGSSATEIEELYQNQRKANEDLNTTIHQNAHSTDAPPGTP